MFCLSLHNDVCYCPQNPEAQDGSGSEQGDRSSLPGAQGDGQEGDDLSDNVTTAEGGLSEEESNRKKNLRRRK